jgi:streptogramin lyase
LEDRRTPSSFNQFPLPDLDLNPRLAQAITAGPDGNVWFTEAGGLPPAVGRITPDGTITEFPLPGPRSGVAITAGPDGNVWFTEEGESPQIGRITPDGTVTEFPLAGLGFAELRGITAGPDGNLWFTATNFGADEIGRITPDGSVTQFAVPPGPGDHSPVTPDQITAGADGNLWFTAGDLIGRVTTDGQFTYFEVPGANRIAAGADGNLWFTGFGFNQIGRITPDGTVTGFPIPSPGFDASTITAGPDGNLYFTWGLIVANSGIGRITTDGTATLIFNQDPGSEPFRGITAGSDGNLWLAEPVSIGQFVLGDGAGAGGGAAAAAPAGLAQAVGRLGSDHPAQAAAVDARFAGAPTASVSPVVVGRQSAVAAVDAAIAASRPEVLTLPPAQPEVADSGIMHHHPADRPEAADGAGLAGPLAQGRMQVV